MKIFLDDERSEPKGWIRCYWPNEVIELFELHQFLITHISLDHDLGDDTKGTGYTFLQYLEKQVYENPHMYVPTIIVHSMNSSGAEKMRAALTSIKRFSRAGFHGVMAPYDKNSFYYQ